MYERRQPPPGPAAPVPAVFVRDWQSMERSREQGLREARERHRRELEQGGDMGLQEIRGRDDFSRQSGRRRSGRNHDRRPAMDVDARLHGQHGSFRAQRPRARREESHRNPERPAPAIPAQPQVRGAEAAASSTGYAEVYEGRQRRGPARMRGDGTASGSARTPPQQVTADIHTSNVTRNPTPFIPSESEVQTSRNGAGASGGAIYDVGITDYSSNGHSQEWQYEKGYQRLDSQGYELPISVPSKYTNKEPEMYGENVYQEIDDIEMMIQGDDDGDDDSDVYEDTKL